MVNLRIVGTESIAERFGALAELRRAGLIRHLGLSNVTPAHLAEARAIAPVVCVQNRYGIGVRPEDDAFVQDCGAQGIAFVPFYSIAAAGGQGGAIVAEPAEVLAVAQAHGVSPAQVRLAWTLHRGPHVLAIPGTGDLGHLAANVAAGSSAAVRGRAGASGGPAPERGDGLTGDPATRPIRLTGRSGDPVARPGPVARPVRGPGTRGYGSHGDG
ncbi:hypothetical protein SMICM304S_03991 [Streptomyces microflavus]